MGHFQDEVLTVIRRVDDNWAEGKLRDKIGIFPLLYVEVRPPHCPASPPPMYLEVRSLPSSAPCCTWK